MIKRIKDIYAGDYRHYIATGITLVFLGFVFLFYNSIPRLAETVRDLFVSLGYYICGIFVRAEFNPVTPTVNELPSWQFWDSPFEPLRLFPWTWEEFQVLWGEYWKTWATWENVLEYFSFLADFIYYGSKILILVLPLILLGYLLVGNYISEDNANNDNNIDSKYLASWKGFKNRFVDPVVLWIRDFISFIQEKPYFKLWLFFCGLYFNVFSIIVAFFAYYFYFVMSFDFLSLYTQLIKLLLDLTHAVRFLPGIIWFVAAYILFLKHCNQVALDSLYQCEARNQAFISERGVVTTVYGNMGVGKTALITSMALSEEVIMRRQAFEIMLECDMMFPQFPWCNLRSFMKRKMDSRQFVDLNSIRKYINYLRGGFEYSILTGKLTSGCYFEYDVSRCPIVYNNELKTVFLYDAIEDYCCAYFIYAIETSLIISNYSIRTDANAVSLGNLPLWDDDFFMRNPRYQDAYSRHSHIIDFDMLRLGKKMVEDNPNRNAFGFGVYVISEIDKERKNALELREVKTSDTCSQKNDLFNACLKMSRHACVVSNRVFLKIFCDLQRPEDWGAGGREVGEIVFISSKGELSPALPFYSPFWFLEMLHSVLITKFNAFYSQYMYVRSDNTLLVYLIKNLLSKFDNYITRTKNKYGVQQLHLEVESGRMDGSSQSKLYFRLPKKDYSNRYQTDCLSSIFEPDIPNTVSIADFIEYADIMASSEELALQNSHFQRDLSRTKDI